MTKNKCNLQGLSVLVTRPATQANALCELISEHHARPVRFPVMEIVAVIDTDSVMQQLKSLTDFDRLIFISVNAVDYAFDLLPEDLPASLKIAAIGDKTAQRLVDIGLDPDIVPTEKFDTENLLLHSDLQNLADKKVMIVRGNGGRELLAEELVKRGAQVEYAEVYQRIIPKRNASNLIENWQDMVHAVVVTSIGMFDNLVSLLGETGFEKLIHTPIVVVSIRIAEYASNQGCESVWIADNVTDEAILSALCEIVENEF